MEPERWEQMDKRPLKHQAEEGNQTQIFGDYEIVIENIKTTAKE
jgi:hypothetical protein